MALPSFPSYIEFHDYPKFAPNLSPRKMLEIGVFGGSYLWKKSRRKHLPQEFFKDLPLEKYDLQFPLAGSNYFGILVPERNRDIPTHLKEHDGWFHWYLDFFYGHRNRAEDLFRIGQWTAELKTLSFYIRGETTVTDNFTNDERFPVWKQHLLHFAWLPLFDPIKFI